LLAKNVNDNAALSGSQRCPCVFREQARSYKVRKRKGPWVRTQGPFLLQRYAYAALASCWLNERFSALNSALKLAVVMFSSIPTPCTGRSPFTRSSM